MVVFWTYVVEMAFWKKEIVNVYFDYNLIIV